MKQRNATERNRVSGLLGALTLTEGEVAKAWMEGRNPAAALAAIRGKDKPGPAERADVRAAMASERVRRTLQGVVGGGYGVRGSDLRRYVLERLVTEAEDAREGGARLRALELIGDIPGVDVWKAADKPESLADAGAALADVLASVADRLAGDVVDVDAVQGEPDRGIVEGEGDDAAGDDDDAADPAQRQDDGQTALDPWA